MKKSRNNSRYAELLAKYIHRGGLETPAFLSVQVTERSLRTDVAGAILARVDAGQVALLVCEEYKEAPNGSNER